MPDIIIKLIENDTLAAGIYATIMGVVLWLARRGMKTKEGRRLIDNAILVTLIIGVPLMAVSILCIIFPLRGSVPTPFWK